MTEINIKPLSVNQAWAGRRFKTPAYKKYEKDLLFLLPNKKIDLKKRLSINIEVYYSSHASDIDNFLKPFLDVLQKKYGIDDKNIYSLVVAKNVVKKGMEKIVFKIENL
jgi:Holliday junction resolvase RusA-like endonuclease